MLAYPSHKPGLSLHVQVIGVDGDMAKRQSKDACSADLVHISGTCEYLVNLRY